MSEYDYNDKIPRNLLTRVKSGFFSRVIAHDDFGAKIPKVAESATRFGTQLWFEDQNDYNKVMPDLVATGQFTMCYNLIVYTEGLQENYELDEDNRNEITKFHNELTRDFVRFRKSILHARGTCTRKLKSH